MTDVKDLRKAMFRGRPPVPILPSRGQRPGGEPSFMKKDYSPLQAKEYFGQARFIDVNNDLDRLYLYETAEPSSNSSAPYLLFFHGGGYSGLTWAPLIKELSHMITADFGAIDIRGHGRSTCADEADLSTNTVTEDLFQLVMKLNINQRPLILIGHSMGGAFAIHLASRLQEESDMNLAALIVIDVVEGSALEALSGMQTVLRNRPREFTSLQTAIEWCVRSGQTRNVDSARVSMPGQLKLLTGEIPKSTMVDDNVAAPVIKENPQPTAHPDAKGDKLAAISEDDDGDGPLGEGNDDSSPDEPTCSLMKAPPPPPSEKYVWRIDLKKTEPYWREWFEGLSGKFLSITAPKLLLLAGVDRLDKELMVAQMQGKFQMQVLTSVGHMVHEDAPDRVAENIASFLVRNKLIESSEQIPRVFPGC